ncbi:hypothetical protein LTR84_006541 [Exophiala bonariae]|uniref:Transcription factor domain-containing protein n=1 Tax=Exophiala bonariae TaxID=1690606 RepID=A0AAV9N464_9EURO|nr:hypothetical protein LTR84_006541 [Exophiala bonariae]
MPFLKENYARRAPLPTSMLFEFSAFSSRLLDAISLTPPVIHHFGPVCIWRPRGGNLDREVFKANFLHYMFREPALLEAMFCAALRTLEVCPSDVVLASKESKQHYGNSISLLTQRVSDPSAVFDDAIFWAIATLMLYDLDRRSWESFLVNLDGIRRIISLRGGKSSGQVSSDRSHSFHEWAEKCYADRNETALSAVPFVILTPHDGVRPEKTIARHVSDPLNQLRNYATFCPEGIRSMQLGNMLEPESINSIGRFLAWYNTYTMMSSADRRTGKIAGDRTSLIFELHQLLSRGILGARSRVVCLAMFALTLMVHPIFTGPGFVGTFSGDMTDFSYISTHMLSEDHVIWLALVLAPMHTMFFIQSEDRCKLLHMVAAHQQRSTSWTDVLNKVRRFIAPKNLLVEWESCWHSATQALPRSS